MPFLPFHPAPGLGDLLPGSFVVPQNPIRPDSTALVPSVQAANGGQVAYRPRMGDLLPGSFVVPQNPIIRTLATGGMSGIGCPGCGGSAYDGGGWHSSGLQGLGALDLTGVTDWFTGSMIAGVPNWALVAGGVVAYMLFMPGGSEYRAKRAELRSQYRGYRRAAGRVGSYA